MRLCMTVNWPALRTPNFRLREHISKMKILLSLFRLSLAIVVLCPGCTLVQQGAIEQAQSRIGKGKYEDALQALRQAEHATTPTPAIEAEIGFLKGVCY